MICGFVADHQSMVTKFEKAMAKLAVLGQNPRALTDCSEVIPVPKKATSNVATFPPGKTRKDIEASVRTARCFSSFITADERNAVQVHSFPCSQDPTWSRDIYSCCVSANIDDPF